MIMPARWCAACLAGSMTLLALDPRQAGAGNLTLGGSFTQRLEGATSSDSTTDSGSGFGYIAEIDLAVSYATPTTQFRIAPGVRGSVGFGGDGGSVSDDVLPRLDGGLFHSRPRDDFSATFSIVPSQASETLFDEVGQVSRDIIQITSSAGLGWVRRISETRRLRFSTTVSDVRYTSDPVDLDESQRVSALGAYEIDLTPRTSLGLIGDASMAMFDDGFNTENTRLGILGTVDHALNGRWSLDGSLGLSLTSLDTSDPSRDSGDSIDFNGSIGASYETPGTTWSVGLSQGVLDSVTGEPRTVTSAFIRSEHAINQVSSLSFSTSLSDQNNQFVSSSDTEARTTLSFAPTYQLLLAPDWSMQAGYRLRMDIDGDETDNLVFLQLNRVFTLLQ